MQIIEIDGFMARCQANGIERDVNLFMMQNHDISTGDYVMVHVGYAIEKIQAQQARSAWEAYDQMLTGDDHA